VLRRVLGMGYGWLDGGISILGFLLEEGDEVSLSSLFIVQIGTYLRVYLLVGVSGSALLFIASKEIIHILKTLARVT
jgi:hypothetical protein